MANLKETGPSTKTATWRAYASYDQGATWVYSHSGTEIMSAYHSTTSGENTPDYWSRKRNGELLPYTNFSQSEYSLTAGTSLYTLAKQGASPWYKRDNQNVWVAGANRVTEGALAAVLNPLEGGLDPQPMVQAAAAKVYSQGHDTLTSIVELRKTLRLFKDLKRRLAELTKLSKLARNWLEYRYGWRILVLDILELQSAFQSLSDDRKRFNDRVGVSSTSVTDEEVDNVHSGGLVSHQIVRDKIHLSTRGSISADLDPPVFRFNPVLTGWEIIRFSFIVDWFIQVGQWLEGLSFLYVVEQYEAAGGTYATLERTLIPVNCTWTGPITDFTYSLGTSTATLALTTRVPLKVSLRPFANIKLDVAKIADLAALIFESQKSSAFSKSLRL